MKEQINNIIKEGIDDIEKVKKQYPQMKTQDVLDALRRLQDRINELTIPVVGWRSEQLPEFDIDDINEIIEECEENKDSLETLISRIWNRGLITGVNSEAEINSK